MVLAEVAALWIVANAAYNFLFPVFGIGLSYNAAPIAFAVYFLLWAMVTRFNFRELFFALLPERSAIWKYGALSFACALVIWLLLFVFSHTQALQGPLLVPYSDILLATPWYFLPKAAEIFMQQSLIAALVYALAVRFHSLKKIVLGYILTFGFAHVGMYFVGSPTPYATIMTIAAVASAGIFPYLLLRVRGGFVLAYTIHLIFYIVLALTLHTWPPPDYIGV